MKLQEENIPLTIDEIFIVESLNLNFKTILELGCGTAAMTQKIATNGHTREVIACDVDEIQHKKNLELDIKNIKFLLCGAQKLPIKDESIDFVFMFKSFHHVPKEYMNDALSEIKRVLKPRGMLYISEPLHMGKQNELVAMFHNEEEVRKDAFECIKDFVENEEMKLFKEFFFQTPITYKSFDDFVKRQMHNTYNEISVSDELKQKVNDKYNEFGGKELTLLKPFRVDILQKNR
ncbi:class I SAM-dependent methyltransferase [Halarcobacter ebronensis]|uniref:SAM-dependent methyltransferase n=1 Tax=Halarcobacter ebronensis TaxID=1462615 RepID=A0A4Q1ARJ4_9BACT|nr:class I SAM-dependent methyltransferase [Halarcobacter ebronensis]QKF81891.1 SAM-dependent methyltransferase [Halarcobacter ebronensis]RXK02156.1 SAM-dependent methyltransferase [Halarcobacter ebronensis]